MTRVVTNKILHPTKRYIENWKRDFRTSDGPNTSSFINLDDVAIPYDNHYMSRVILPADTYDFFLTYGGTTGNTTFLLIKVTYNGNYDYPNEDEFDPYYRYEKNTYNIEYYFEGNSGKTYPINNLLVLNGSYTTKIPRIYLNNPLDYDVELEILHADIIAPDVVPPSTGITINNLYYSDIITDQIICGVFTGTTTTTTSSTTLPPTTTTTTTIFKDPMRIYKDNIDSYIVYFSRDETMGLWDYYYVDQWFYDGEESNFLSFTNTNGISRIRFYFEENSGLTGILKTDEIYPIGHNNGLYFVDVDPDLEYLDPIYVPTGSTSGNTTTTTSTTLQPIGPPYTGSTEFIISEYQPTTTGYTVVQYIVPYDTINSITQDLDNNSIYLDTQSIYYTLNFLTEYDCIIAYSRMMFAYDSYINGLCRYITEDNMFNNNVSINCSYPFYPVIYYNNSNIDSGYTWIGSGTTTPSNIHLELYHNGLTGWTLNELKYLFISGITDCVDGDIDLSIITFNLYENGESVLLTGITDTGIYDIYISFTDTSTNTVTDYISNIYVGSFPPTIVYEPFVLTSLLTGNTNTYTGFTSGITSDIYISSGFVLNLSGFDMNKIDRIDILNNIVDYVYDDVDVNINKYMLDVLIVSDMTGIETVVTNSGYYCVKFSIEDSNGNKIEDYKMMYVVSNTTVYSFGIWLDDRVWVDSILWIDHLSVN